MRTVRIVLVALLAVLSLSAAWGQTGKGATVSYLEGQVTIDGTPASIGDAVPMGATVATGDQSLCEIVFGAKNAIRLAAATTFVFNPGNLQTGSSIAKGSIVLVLKQLSALSAAATFTVRTPNAVAGVRGTSFFIDVLDPNTTYICSCNGSVHVEDPSGGSSKDMVASHHKATLFTTGPSGVSAADATLLYHTDADVEAVARDIGATIDWTTPGP